MVDTIVVLLQWLNVKLSYELSVSESVSMRPECSDFVSIMISFSV